MPVDRRRWLYHLLCVIVLIAGVWLAVSPGRALVEPDERELRGAYMSFLKASLAGQGTFTDPNCDIGGKGCSVRLLDMRRDYRLTAFKRRSCRVAGDTAFVCQFDANVRCAYSAQGKPKPEVADLYCGPLYNKISAFTALFHYQAPGWIIERFVTG